MEGLLSTGPTRLVYEQPCHISQFIKIKIKANVTITFSGGRPYSPALSKPDNWGVTAGDKMLGQQQGETR